MAAASDKARFYLEQYVPELQEYERKGIFTADEITAIASKRNDFEHTLNAPGSKPSDYARYATYEMNVDRLRKKRSKRLGIKTTAFSGSRTIFFILDRATKKFPGDMGLWMQYIRFCQREKANKKLTKVFTSVLRLKPREWNLWVLAAKHYAEHQGDMVTARSYMQRGLRFCKDEVGLWLEYMRLEMSSLTKLLARGKSLGPNGSTEETESSPVVDNDDDVIALPDAALEDVTRDADNAESALDPEVLQKLLSTPIFTGAVPIAVFDAAMKQFPGRPDVAEQFFDLVATFNNLPASLRILGHILESIQIHSNDSAESFICVTKISVYGADITSAQFALQLGDALRMVKDGRESLPPPQRQILLQKATLFLLPFLRRIDELDEDVVAVLESSMRRYLRLLQAEQHSGAVQVVEQLRRDGRDDDAMLVSGYLPHA